MYLILMGIFLLIGVVAMYSGIRHSNVSLQLRGWFVLCFVLLAAIIVMLGT